MQTRICPGCKTEKTFPMRQRFCSHECYIAGRYVHDSAAFTNREQAARVSAIPSDEFERVVLAELRGNPTVSELSEKFDRSEATIQRALDSLKAQGYNVDVRLGQVALSDQVRPGTDAPAIVHNLAAYENQWSAFGATGDNHLGSRHERLDVLNALYDVYESEGITTVFNTGNWIEGNSRLNYHDVKVIGLDDQVDYFIENYPQRKGIITRFIAGDDHEGWFQKAERIEIGRYAEHRARTAGRTDLEYMGYVEADVELKAQEGSSWIKVMHPGGGSAYAHSYAPQKLVESFQGGEKPNVLIIGHYHKFEYCFPRDVHVIQTGCTCDQSIFMRKQKIQAHVGGCIFWINQAPDGSINRFRAEWLPFFDRDFYKNRREFGLAKAV